MTVCAAVATFTRDLGQALGQLTGESLTPFLRFALMGLLVAAGWLRDYSTANQQATASKWEAVAQKDDAVRAAANAGERLLTLHH